MRDSQSTMVHWKTHNYIAHSKLPTIGGSIQWLQCQKSMIDLIPGSNQQVPNHWVVAYVKFHE